MNFLKKAAIGLTSAVGIAVVAAAAGADESGKPFAGRPIVVPGVIRATEYDISPDAKNDVTFHYDGDARASDIRPTPDGVGLGHFDKSHVTTKGEPEDVKQTYLGWTQEGEWTKYTLHVADAGTYVIGGHFAAADTGGQISFSFGPGITTGPIEIPTTAGFQPGVEVYHVWESLDHLAEVKLPAGDIVMTMKIEKSGGFNIESITLTKK